jgi:hypothetical protein
MTQTNHAAVTRNPQGSGLGAAICAGFAALWAVTGAFGLSTAFANAVYMLAALITVPLLFGCVRLIRAGRHRPACPDPSAARRRRGWFLVVLVIEIVAINLIVGALSVHHMDGYRMPAVALIVGLHFFPLARVFAMPHYLLTGALMTGASGLGIAMLASGFNALLCNTGVDFICAVTLWTTALLTLRLWHRRRAQASGV